MASPHASDTLLIEQLHAAILQVNADGVVVQANAAALSLWAPQRVIGSTLESLTTELAEAAQRCQEQTQAQWLRDLALRMSDGRHEFADVFLQTIDDERGSFFLVELHRRPQAWQEEASARQVDAFTRALAHELHNPLAGLRGAAQLLAQDAPRESQREMIDIIIAESRRIEALSRQLLGARNPPQLTALNVHQVLDRAIVGAQLEAAPQCKIERDYDPSLPSITADADQIQQLMLNLLKNAAQAGAQRIFVRTRLARQLLLGTTLRKIALKVEVIDDGCGVSEDRLEAIFLPLVSGRINGHGFGLAIARSIAYQHGGSLNCRSIPGETVFTLSLPFAQSDTP
jgi:two-component system, NtrC family, nitrogen regulation sensor histidine kinase GlnL